MTDHKIDALIYSLFALQPRRADAAGVLIRDRDRYLLVKSPYKKYWDLPGGMVERGESPMQAARREVLEELGIELAWPMPVLVADYLNATDTRAEGVRWVFGSYLIDRRPLRLQADEIEDFEWCTRARITQLTCYHAPMLERRIQAAISASQHGQETLMVDGWPRQHRQRIHFRSMEDRDLRDLQRLRELAKAVTTSPEPAHRST